MQHSKLYSIVFILIITTIFGLLLALAGSALSERQQFNATIASMQGPQWMMADAYTQLEASRL